MSDVITTILTDSSARSDASVRDALMRNAEHAQAWFDSPAE